MTVLILLKHEIIYNLNKPKDHCMKKKQIELMTDLRKKAKQLLTHNSFGVWAGSFHQAYKDHYDQEIKLDLKALGIENPAKIFMCMSDFIKKNVKMTIFLNDDFVIELTSKKRLLTPAVDKLTDHVAKIIFYERRKRGLLLSRDTLFAQLIDLNNNDDGSNCINIMRKICILDEETMNVEEEIIRLNAEMTQLQINSPMLAVQNYKSDSDVKKEEEQQQKFVTSQIQKSVEQPLESAVVSDRGQPPPNTNQVDTSTNDHSQERMKKQDLNELLPARLPPTPISSRPMTPVLSPPPKVELKSSPAPTSEAVALRLQKIRAIVDSYLKKQPERNEDEYRQLISLCDHFIKTFQQFPLVSPVQSFPSINNNGESMLKCNLPNINDIRKYLPK